MSKKILFAVLWSFIFINKTLYSQNTIVINTGLIDGMELNNQNLLSYQIISNLNYSLNADVNGTLFYRGSDYRISYTYSLKINPGINQINTNSTHINWTYSSAGLRELFEDHNKLPAGTYQYCIKVTPKNVAGEHDYGNTAEECLYNKNEELFLINLLEPENDAKLYEKNPSLSWIANYSFSNELTYQLRVAEIKRDQNTVTAISRNRPVYAENGLRQNTLIYPMSAKQLQVNQPYAWTVDAFYKGILLGGAEPWKFTIIEDTVNEVVPKDMSYIEVNIEDGSNTALIAGEIKLKYIEKTLRKNILSVRVLNAEKKVVKGFSENWNVAIGESRIIYNFYDLNILKHKRVYYLSITDTQNKQYLVRFKYFNPDFLK